MEGEEHIEVIVNGEIFDFEQIALIWHKSINRVLGIRWSFYSI